MRDAFKFEFSNFKHKGVIHIIPTFMVVYEPLCNCKVLTFDFTFLQTTFYFAVYYYFEIKDGF